MIGIPLALREVLESIPVSKRKGYVLPSMADSYSRDPSVITKKIQKYFTECGIQTLREQTGREWYDEAHKKWEAGGRKGAEPAYQRAVVEVGFHSLRHTYVSLHAERGTPQAVLQAMVGHSTAAMTQHYTHIGETAAVKAAGALDYGITDAEYEVIEDPIPKWVIEKLKEMDATTWEPIREELLCKS